MREYETTYIVRADLTDDAVRQLNDRITAIIERHKGVILQHHKPGRQTLAYCIEKQQKGNYVFFNYAASTDVVSDIERALRLDENILKFLSVKINDNVNVAQRLQEIKARNEAIALAVATATVSPTEVTIEEGANG